MKHRDEQIVLSYGVVPQQTVREHPSDRNVIEVGVRLIVVAVVVQAVAVTNDSLGRVARDLDAAVLVLSE